MTDDEELATKSALAAALFPVPWAKWSAVDTSGGSKRRQELRKAAHLEVTAMAPLRAHGASCGNCGAYEQSHRPVHGQDCKNLDRYHGYVRSAMSDLCPHWAPKRKTPP